MYKQDNFEILGALCSIKRILTFFDAKNVEVAQHEKAKMRLPCGSGAFFEENRRTRC